MKSTNETMNSLANTTIQVLDYGFIRLIDYMGDDSSIVQAARVSYGEGTKKVSEDRALIRYLMRHQHTSPFEMCEIKLHVKLPIFVARQWIRQRTASLNECSARYSILKDEFYTPAKLYTQSTTNKQGAGEPIVDEHQHELLETMHDSCDDSFSHYSRLIKSGVSREASRIVLPVATYTEWYWKIDLHNLLNFLSKRLKPDAQEEIRLYAEAISEIVKFWVPHTWEAFQDYKLDAYTLSRQEVEILSHLLRGEKPDYALQGLTKREQDEFQKKFNLA